jgi:hypothetical protein
MKATYKGRRKSYHLIWRGFASPRWGGDDYFAALPRAAPPSAWPPGLTPGYLASGRWPVQPWPQAAASLAPWQLPTWDEHATSENSNQLFDQVLPYPLNSE